MYTKMNAGLLKKLRDLNLFRYRMCMVKFRWMESINIWYGWMMNTGYNQRLFPSRNPPRWGPYIQLMKLQRFQNSVMKITCFYTWTVHESAMPPYVLDWNI